MAVAALREHAARAPEEPWLFHRPGLDWRWRSFGQVAAQVAAGAETLRSWQGRRVGFDGRTHPDSVAVDLAVQAAGAVACPLPPEELLADDPREFLGRLDAALRRHGCAAHAAVAGRPDGRGEAPSLPRILLPTAPEREPAELPELADAAGAAVVVAAQEIEEIEVAHLEALVRNAFAPLPPSSPKERDVLMLAGDLTCPATRMALTWATLTGAAVTLEDDAEFWPATAVWVRPTILLAEGDHLTRLLARWPPRLASVFGPASWRRWPRLKPPWNRLRGVLLTGPAEGSNEWRRRWRGVEVARLELDLRGIKQPRP